MRRHRKRTPGPLETFELTRESIRIRGKRRLFDVFLIVVAGIFQLFLKVADNLAGNRFSQLAIVLGVIVLLAMLIARVHL